MFWTSGAGSLAINCYGEAPSTRGSTTARCEGYSRGAGVATCLVHFLKRINMKNTETDIWKDLKDNMNHILEFPLVDFSIWRVSVFIWKSFKFDLDICETFPYQPDGTIPLIFFRIGWVEFMFENYFLYKKLYRRKYKFDPAG